MSDDSDLLPNTTIVVEEISNAYKEKLQLVEDEITLLQNLLYSGPNNSKNAQHLHLPGNCKQKTSLPRRASLDSPKPKLSKPKPLTLRNSSSPVHTPHPGPQSPDANTDENTCPEASSCVLEQILKKGLPQEIKECMQAVNDYIQLKKNPDKKCELERQNCLLRIESSWEEEFKTFQIFEPDLAECLYKYLSVIEEKEPEDKLDDWPASIFKREEIAERADKFLVEAQNKIDAALCEDFNNIDLDTIKSEENISLAVKLNEAVITLNNIREPKTPIIFKKEPCHDALLESLDI